MTLELDHIAVACASLDGGLKVYRDLLGLSFVGSEVVADQRVKVAMFMAGSTRIELLAPTAPDSPVAKFIHRRGEGLHHIALCVNDLDGVLQRLRASGARLIDEKPRVGAGGCRIAFLHPSAASGVLIELVERG